MRNLMLFYKGLRYQWLVVGTVLLAALVRLPTLARQSMWFDEAYAVAVATSDWPTLLQATLTSGVHPPLFYILAKLLLTVWGTTEYGARFIAVTPALLTIPVVYRLGQAMFSRSVGLLAAVLLAMNPLHVWLSQEARMYGLFILLATGSMFLFWLALRTDRRQYWLGLFLLHTLAFNLHYFSLLIPTIQFGVILTHFARYLHQFRKWTVVQFLAGLTLLPWVVATALREAQSFGIGSLQQPNLLDLPLSLWNLATGFSLHFFWPLAVGGTVLFAAALLNGLRQRDRKARFAQAVLAWWLFLPLGTVWLVSQRRSFYTDRYLAFVIPSLVLLVAWGVIRIRPSYGRNLMIAGVIIASGYGLLNISFDPAFYKDNWRAVSAYVAERDQAGDVILLYNTHINLPFDYYYRGTVPRRPITHVMENFPLGPLTAGHKRAWVIYPYHRHPTHDPKRPLRLNGYWTEDTGRNPLLVEWFETYKDNLVDYHHFRGIELWLVDLDQPTQRENNSD